MHPVQFPSGLVTTGKPGLVGGCDENETSAFKFLQSRFCNLHHFELLKGQRRYRLLWSRANLVQDRVPFDKDCSLHLWLLKQNSAPVPLTWSFHTVAAGGDPRSGRESNAKDCSKIAPQAA